MDRPHHKEYNKKDCEIAIYPYYSEYANKKRAFFTNLLYQSAKACTYPYMKVEKGENDKLYIENFELKTKFDIAVKVVREGLDLSVYGRNEMMPNKEGLMNVFLIDGKCDNLVADSNAVFNVIDYYLGLSIEADIIFQMYLINTNGNSEFLLSSGYFTSNKKYVYYFNKQPFFKYKNRAEDISKLESTIKLRERRSALTNCTINIAQCNLEINFLKIIFNNNKEIIYE